MLAITAAESDALAISTAINARFVPYGTILSPVYGSATSNQIIGYSRCGDSAIWTGHHLAAAHCVVSGEADVCLATRSAAQAFGLDFIALHSERYDFVMHKNTADLPATKEFLDVLQRSELRRMLEVLAGYDTSKTGEVISMA